MSGVVPSPYKFTPNRPTDLGEAPAMAQHEWLLSMPARMLTG